MAASGLAYGLPSTYETLISKLEDLADKSSCGTVKQSGVPVRECFKKVAQSNTITFDCTLQLRNWPARKERIHIVIHAQETISGAAPNFVLAKSTVRVSYYAVAGTKTTPLHTVHFDYGPAQKCHPIFHAQISSDHVTLSEEDLIDLGHEMEVQPDSKIFKNARIPTPDMSLSSVLLCLVADHVDQAFFDEFLSEIRELQDRLPHPAFERTKESLQAQAANFRSSHWYAHH